MKNKLLVLARTLLKNSINPKAKQKGKKSSYVIIFILIVAFVPIVAQLSIFTSKAYDFLSQINQQGIVLSIGITLNAFVIFFFGIFYVLNTFYFANDMENLLYLPVSCISLFWHPR